MPMASNGSGDKPRKDVAVYIDYENLYISLRSTVGKNPNFDVILDKCREFGRLTVTRAYADWSEFARVVTSQLFASGVDPIYVPTRKFYDAKTRSQATKNSVDIHITIDIMKDVLQARNIDCFVLVSGDRDFVPLMNQIRAAGKEVYAIGVAGCTSGELAVAVDEMFYYHQLLESDEELANEQRDIYAKLVRAVEVARARGYRATLGVVKPIMREVVVGFDERKFRNPKGQPFQQFKAFVKEAERQGFIRVLESGESVELFLASENPADARRAQDEKAAAQRSRGRTTESRGAAASHAQANGGNGADGEAAGAAEGEEGGETASSGTGRRRGRRGGRGRRRGRGGLAAEGAAAGGDNAEEEEGALPPEDDDDGSWAARSTLEAERAATGGRGSRRPAASFDADRDDDDRDDRDDEEVDDVDDVTESAEGDDDDDRDRPQPPAREASRAAAAPSARAATAVARAAAADDEEIDADDEAFAGLEDLTLPEEAFDDLEVIMRGFDGRVPSQRRLIKKLKEAAASGDLRGEYRDGQFLLLVRKALQEGYLEKVSKGFYAGVRWNDARA